MTTQCQVCFNKYRACQLVMVMRHICLLWTQPVVAVSWWLLRCFRWWVLGLALSACISCMRACMPAWCLSECPAIDRRPDQVTCNCHVQQLGHNLVGSLCCCVHAMQTQKQKARIFPANAQQNTCTAVHVCHNVQTGNLLFDAAASTSHPRGGLCAQKQRGVCHESEQAATQLPAQKLNNKLMSHS